VEAKYPVRLHSVDFVRIRFQLEFQEPYLLTLEAALRLRRNLRQALHPAESEYFQQLFEPPLPSDPVAVRRFQRPSPLFVLLPPSDLPRTLLEGDLLDLEVLFWGTGVHQLGDFSLVLQALGAAGWHRGEGRFNLVQLGATNHAGGCERIWQVGQSPLNLAPPVLSAAWWLEESGVWEAPLQLEFLSPARILSGGRPLFQPNFVRLFPFFLRRVTSMVHACCGVEILDDPEPLLKASSAVIETSNTLHWSDWRTLEGESSQELGGVTGSVFLQGDILPEILWILNLASLMNLGKGASYGAGHFRLSEHR
jgi:hypothetical protein